MTRQNKNLTTLDVALGKLPRSERKDVEPAGDRFMAQLGFTSIHFSQSRATMQTPGISDRKYCNPVRGKACWWEAKAEDGRQTKAEHDFQKLVESCGEVYLLGTEEVLAAWCQDGCPTFSSTHAPGDMLDRFRPQQFRYREPKRRQ